MQIIPNAVAAAKSLSSNSVQQHILAEMFNYFNTHHDDGYDVANFISAIRKGAQYIEDEAVNNTDYPRVLELITAAMQDWPNGDPFNKPKY